jgi:hypothetical protein
MADGDLHMNVVFILTVSLGLIMASMPFLAFSVTTIINLIRSTHGIQFQQFRCLEYDEWDR